MRKQIIKFLFLLLVFGYAMEAKSDEFTVDGIRYYYDYSTKEGEVSVTRSISGKYSADNIVIPSTVTYNGKQYTVTSIGDNAFSSCYNLTKVTIPNSVKTIENSAFEKCWNLKTVTIPNSVKTIENSAFKGCTGLKTVTIGNSVTTIGISAFAGCTGLTEVTIPNSVTTIWSGAFGHCDNLKKVIWNARNVENPPRSSPFSNCDQLTNFIFGENIQSIPSHLCYELKSLNTIIIPNSATSIGDFAFSSCTGLTEVTIGNSVTEIGTCAFSSCTGLTKVTIPNSVTKIGNEVFSSCTGLKKVIWNARYIWDLTTTPYPLFFECDRLTEFVFGEEVEIIPNHLCEGFESLKTIVIGNSVTKIGYEAFAGCTGLTEVTIPNSVTEIGSGAFDSCTGLTTVTMGNSMKNIGSSAFAGCTGLTKVTIPNSVTFIGTWAFKDCSGLAAVTIGNSVNSMGDGVFAGCTGLTTVTMGNSMKNIGSSAFSGCTGLTTMTIPNSVIFIGSSAFADCTGLTTVTMGNSVLSIEDKAFYNCKSLDHVTSKAMLPPRIWATTFDDYAMPLYVPNGCKSRYSGAEYWRNFTDIREATLYKVTANATDETMGYVTGAGEYPKGSTATLVAVPFGQNYFVRWNDGNTDNPRTITVTGDMTFTAEFAPAGSAVETLENGERGIYATGRTLHVENGGESYRVYTAAGRLVYTGNDSSVTLSAPGMYIVRTGDRSQKVAVK